MAVIGELLVILCSLNSSSSWLSVESVEEAEDFRWEEISDVKSRASSDASLSCISDDKMWSPDSGASWTRTRDCTEHCQSKPVQMNMAQRPNYLSEDESSYVS